VHICIKLRSVLLVVYLYMYMYNYVYLTQSVGVNSVAIYINRLLLHTEPPTTLCNPITHAWQYDWRLMF